MKLPSHFICVKRKANMQADAFEQKNSLAKRVITFIYIYVNRKRCDHEE
jgi:hypothetical protein